MRSSVSGTLARYNPAAMSQPTVLAYTHLQRTGNPTSGVGKHIINMVRGLTQSPELNVKLIAPRDLLTDDGQVPAASLLRDLRVQSLPWKQKWLERSSRLLNWPSIDRWVGPADCLYSPAEVYLRTKLRLIITAHDVIGMETNLPWSNDRANRLTRRNWQLYYRRLRQSHAEVVTVSEFTRQRIITLAKFPESRVHRVGNGVEEAFFDATPLPPDERVRLPYVIVVGISWRKGAYHILELARQLLSGKSPLTIVAIGALHPEFRLAVEALPNITHLPALPDEALPGLMRNAVALLQLSLYEGFGIPVVEAMASGTPAIVSSTSALPEIAGPAGIVFDMQQTTAYALIIDTLVQLESNSAYRAEVAARGRSWAEQYHWSHCVEALQRVILNVGSKNAV